MSWWGRCSACGARADLAYQPGSKPPRRVCAECYTPEQVETEHTPSVSDYFEAAHALAVMVRRALSGAQPVTRGEIRRALEAFERVDDNAREHH